MGRPSRHLLLPPSHSTRLQSLLFLPRSPSTTSGSPSARPDSTAVASRPPVAPRPRSFLPAPPARPSSPSTRSWTPMLHLMTAQSRPGEGASGTVAGGGLTSSAAVGCPARRNRPRTSVSNRQAGEMRQDMGRDERRAAHSRPVQPRESARPPRSRAGLEAAGAGPRGRTRGARGGSGFADRGKDGGVKSQPALAPAKSG